MSWTNPDLRLYHGTVDTHVPTILAGVSLTIPVIRFGCDFGRGFYTSTSEQQAREWGVTLSRQNRYQGTLPAVVYFELSRDAISQLDSLWFVRGNPSDDAFWSLVQHFRSFPRGQDHCRTGNSPWYDAVVGPMARNWKTRRIVRESDQVSFHTDRAVTLLNSATKGRLP